MGRVGEGGRSGWRWNCCAGRASRKKQRQKPRGKTALEGNGTGWIIRSMSNSMVTGSKEVCRGSQENLVAADVTYRFFFLFFRILPVMVISLSLLFWFNRLVFVLFFGFLVEPEGSRSERRCNISMEFSKRDLLCVRVFGWRINSS